MTKAVAKHVAIIAHSYGGIVTTHLVSTPYNMLQHVNVGHTTSDFFSIRGSFEVFPTINILKCLI